MAEKVHLAVGVMGNAASLLLFSTPVITFTRVVRKRSTEGFSCIPYIISLFSCLIYTWYALPVVSYKWENFAVATINGLGIFFELSFVFIYARFAPSKEKKKVVIITLGVLLVSGAIAAVTSFALHDHRHRKIVTGSVGLVAASAMYGSPLVVMREVIKTKSVEFMPFYLSFFSFLASSLWMVYGLLSHDLFLASPNFVGSPLGLLQLVLYCMYRKRGMLVEEPNKWDIEKSNDHDNNVNKPKLHELTAQNTNSTIH